METEICNCKVIHLEIVKKAQKGMPNDCDLYDLADFFKVVGDCTRIKILCALDQSEMCVCDLAALLNMSKSSISHQLKALRLANLVKFRRAGKIVFYSIADEHVKKIFEMGMAHIKE